MKRYFTKKDHSNLNPNSRRQVFWEICVLGTSVSERAGVVSMPGSLQSSEWDSAENAMIRAEQLIQDKLRDDYRESDPPEQGTWSSQADAETEEQFLKALEEVENDSSGHFYFNPPATKDAIDELEYECGIILPATLRLFLSHYNGGFIWQPNSKRFNHELQDMKSVHPDWDEVELKRETIWPKLCDIEEIRKCCIWSQSYFWGPGVIPFCKTHNGELLCVWSMRQPDQDSPVFNSFHESPINEWEILYPTFAHLFIDFVKRKTFDSGWAPYYNDEIEKSKV